MLNRLPVELLRHVFRHLAPLVTDHTPYHERQRALKQCCLVCRTFRDVAQPLLREVVRIERLEQLEALEQAVAEDSLPPGGFRLLAAPYAAGLEVDDLLKLCCRLSGLEEVELNSGHEMVVLSAVELADVLPNLRHLALDFFCISPSISSTSPLFPVLQSLSLSDIMLETAELALLVSPSATPNLRALRFARCPEGEALDAAFAAEHLKRLDLLHIDLSSETPDTPSSDYGVPVLFGIELAGPDRFDFERLDEVKPQHLHLAVPTIYGDDAYALRVITSRMRQLAECLQSPPDSPGAQHLRTVSLPETYHPSRQSQTASSVAGLLDACSVRDIQVVWHRGSPMESNMRLNREVWAHLRRRKAREAVASRGA